MNKNELRTRRVAWEIIKRATYRDRRLSDVTAEIFRIEGNNINDQERRFITMLVQGTVRLSGRLDWEIRQVFVGEYEDLKESLRILLRLGVFQLHYMDSIPDYAAVATTVQLAKRIHQTTNPRQLLSALSLLLSLVALKLPLLVVQFPQQLAVLLLLLMVKSVQSLEVHLKKVQVPQILGLVN